MSIEWIAVLSTYIIVGVSWFGCHAYNDIKDGIYDLQRSVGHGILWPVLLVCNGTEWLLRALIKAFDDCR